jgi:hypothetical protein
MRSRNVENCCIPAVDKWPCSHYFTMFSPYVHAVSLLQKLFISYLTAWVQKGYCSMCCQRYGHTKNCCHFKPRCVRCAGDHLTNHATEKKALVISLVENHPANQKGCTVYKDIQKETYPPLRLKQYTPPAQIKPCTSTLNHYSQLLLCYKCRASVTHKPTSSAKYRT